VLFLLGTVLAGAQVPSSSSRVTPNFQNVDIAQVAEAVGQATGVTFILDQRVRGPVNLVNSRPMSPQELYQAFLSILQVSGFAAVRNGDIVKIVPEASVRTLAGTEPGRIDPDSDELLTTVIELKNVNSAQLSAVLRPLVAQYGNLAPVPGTNSLVITDRASNVARIQRIVARVDQASSAGIDVIRLENATAADVVRTLSTLTTGQSPEAGGVMPRIVADDRSNSVLVSGEPAARLRIATYVAHLDMPVADGGGTESRYLKYADAEKVAAKLKEQATGIAAATAGGAAPPGGAAATSADRSVTIWAYKETNSLVITAPPKMMRQLWAIVDKLDIPRAQVLVEAIIADVGTDKSADLGINWAVFSNEDGTSVPAGGFISPIGGANNNPISIVDLTRAIANPAAATAVPLGATFGVGKLNSNGVNFGAMIRALRSDANTNVIATPTLTVTDNEESEFKSAQEVPFITGQYTNNNTSGNDVNPFTTIQRQEVGTILKIKPQLNGSNAMTLVIELESSELAGTTGDAGSQITNKRQFKTTVLVEDGSAIVVGGMIRDSKLTGESRVPFLGRIPLIGEAFKVRNGRRSQTNLMVFIRPKILLDGLQATLETNQKYNRIRDAQLKQGERSELLPILPFDQPPVLPPAQPPPAPNPAPRDSGNAAPAPAEPAPGARP
jgi:general secretion pathway protein D